MSVCWISLEVICGYIKYFVTNINKLRIMTKLLILNNFVDVKVVLSRDSFIRSFIYPGEQDWITT